VGLIQRIIESFGILTVGISINRLYTEKIKPPRSIFLRWPFGHPLGEPGHTDQQHAVLNKVFEVLYTAATPGEIVDVGWRWRREIYPSVFRLNSSQAQCGVLPQVNPGVVRSSSFPGP